MPDNIVLLVQARPEDAEQVINAPHELQDNWDGDGRTQFYWLLTNWGDVMLVTYPTGALYEDLMETISAAFDSAAGGDSRVTHERTQTILLDP